jgi:hypothetical protein
LAFLDEEQDEQVLPEEPERPRRRVGGPERKRQQFLIRRLIGVAVGLGFVILLVFGVRGCLEARKDRGLRNYASDVGSLMSQSEQSGKDFFDVLNSSSSSSSLDAKQQVLAQRDASQALLDRAGQISVPDEMGHAQDAVEQTLTLRRNALTSIAENVTQATARSQTASAISTISDSMGSLYASDILWTQIAKPDINEVLNKENVDAPSLPNGEFMPANATDYLDQTTLVSKLNGLTGGSTTTTGTHGLQLLDTSIGNTSLTADSTTNVPSDANEIDIQVQNSGDGDESAINVTATLGGQDLTGTLPSLSAGQTGTVKIPLTTKPQPGTDVTLEVVVSPVPGEQLTDNNQATYTVVFGS